MIAVEEALRLISENTFDFGTEKIHLDQSLGRILREDMYADRNFPPYDRVTMDGIAIAYASFEAGQRSFKIEGVAAAGSPQQRLSDPSHCMEVMTGAILPKGCDTVIRYEDLDEGEGQVSIVLESLIHGQNVHNKGEDRAQGSIIVKKGDRFIPIDFEKIALFYIEDHYTFVHTFDQKRYLVSQKLDQLETMCDTNFYRANRQFLVNRAAIRDASQYFNRKLLLNLKFDFKEKITVGKVKVTDFLGWLAG